LTKTTTNKCNAIIDEDDEGGEDTTSKSFYSEGTTDTQHTGFATEATNPVLA